MYPLTVSGESFDNSPILPVSSFLYPFQSSIIWILLSQFSNQLQSIRFKLPHLVSVVVTNKFLRRPLLVISFEIRFCMSIIAVAAQPYTTRIRKRGEMYHEEKL